MATQKTLSDSFENLTSNAASAVVKPIAGEIKNITDTAKSQLGDSGTNEQGQASQQQQIATLKQQDDQASQAKYKAARQKLFSSLSTPPRPQKTVADEKAQEKRVEQFKLAEKEKEKKKLPPLSIGRAKTATESNRGASG